MPTRVWPLHPLCKLSEITSDKFAVRGKNSNILVALATHHVKKKPLVRHIAWHGDGQPALYKPHGSLLTLASRQARRRHMPVG